MTIGGAFAGSSSGRNKTQDSNSGGAPARLHRRADLSCLSSPPSDQPDRLIAVVVSEVPPRARPPQQRRPPIQRCEVTAAEQQVAAVGEVNYKPHSEIALHGQTLKRRGASLASCLELGWTCPRGSKRVLALRERGPCTAPSPLGTIGVSRGCGECRPLELVAQTASDDIGGQARLDIG